MIYWFTGQPGHGKTTLALALKDHLDRKAFTKIRHVDGEDLREVTGNKDYTKRGRVNNIRLAQSMALKYLNEGHTVIVSLVSPFRDLREQFKLETGCREIYVFTTEVRGKEVFSVDYEKPEQDFLLVDTTNVSVEESIKKITLHFNL